MDSVCALLKWHRREQRGAFTIFEQSSIGRSSTKAYAIHNEKMAIVAQVKHRIKASLSQFADSMFINCSMRMSM